MSATIDSTLPTTHGRRRPILGCARWLFWRVLVALLVVWLIMFGDRAALWLFRDALADRVAEALQARAPGWRVRVRSLEHHPGEGFVLRGVLLQRGENGREEASLEVDEARVACTTDLNDLLAGQARIQGVYLKRVRLRVAAWSDAAVSNLRGWQVATSDLDMSLMSLVPELRITDGLIVASDPRLGETVLQAVTAAAVVDTSGETPRVHAWIAGGGPRVGRLRWTGSRGLDRGDWKTTLQLRNTQFDPAWSRWLMGLAPNADTHADQLPSLAGAISCDLRLSGDDSGAPPAFACNAQLSDGRIVIGRGARLRNVSGVVTASNSGWRVSGGAARVENATLNFSASQTGWGAAAETTLAARASDLQMTERLADGLPRELRQAWDVSQPKGLMDVQCRARRTGGTWGYWASIRCRDVTAKHSDAPLPLVGLNGVVTITPTTVHCDLNTLIDGVSCKLDGQFDYGQGPAVGWAQLRCDQWVALSPALIGFLDGDYRSFVRELSARGRVRGEMRIEYPRAAEPRYTFEVHLRDASVRYAGFPYPIDAIEGQFSGRNGSVVIQGLKGRKGRAVITCSGAWGGDDSQLTFDAAHLPLDDQLYQALDAHGRAMWEEAQPSGVLDRVILRLSPSPDSDNVVWDLACHQQPRGGPTDGRSLSVFLKGFPYALQDVSGRFVYRNGALAFDAVRARHEATRFETRGLWVRDHRNWRLSLKRLVADNLRLDADLRHALPEPVRQLASRAGPIGRLSLDGVFDFSGGDQAPDVTVHWDAKLDLEDVDVACGVPLKSIRGDVRLQGKADADGYHNRSDLQLDSLVVQGVHVTGLEGPMFTDNGRTLLGAEDITSQERPARLRARTLGGQASLDGLVLHQPGSPFWLHATLQDARLAQASAAWSPSAGAADGKLSAELTLRGADAGRHTWVGEGWASLTEARLYETPFMVRLLRLLAIRPNEPNGLADVRTRLRIEGEQLYLNQIQLTSDGLTLKGDGEVRSDQSVQANLYAAVRGESSDRLLGRVFRAASRQLLQIDVSGRTDDPKITRRPLPELNDALRRLFPEFVENDTPARTTSRPGLSLLRRVR